MAGVRFPEVVQGFYAHHYIQDDYAAFEHFSDGKSARAQS
jgi:hypothetical protein